MVELVPERVVALLAASGGGMMERIQEEFTTASRPLRSSDEATERPSSLSDDSRAEDSFVLSGR